MIPVARKEDLFIQEFEDELIISDGRTNAAHCLTSMAARIWQYCNGYNTIDDIAQWIEADLDIPLNQDTDMRGLVWLALEELQRCDLIQEYLTQPISDSHLSRRKMLKRLSVAGGFAAGAMFPAVRSMMMPEPVIAATSRNSSTCAAKGESCVKISCCENLICRDLPFVPPSKLCTDKPKLPEDVFVPTPRTVPLNKPRLDPFPKKV